VLTCAGTLGAFSPGSAFGVLIGLTGRLIGKGLLGAECELAEMLQKDTILSSLLSTESKRFFICANSVLTTANCCRAALRSFVILMIASLATWSMTGRLTVSARSLPLC
jgi:hypothetical protein